MGKWNVDNIKKSSLKPLGSLRSLVSYAMNFSTEGPITNTMCESENKYSFSICFKINDIQFSTIWNSSSTRWHNRSLAQTCVLIDTRVLCKQCGTWAFSLRCNLLRITDVTVNATLFSYVDAYICVNPLNKIKERVGFLFCAINLLINKL